MLRRLRSFVEWNVRTVDVRRLGRRYVLAVALILLAVGTSHIAAFVAAGQAEADAAIINESGRQRMLSQRILYFLNRLEHGADENVRKGLKQSLATFEASHLSLSTHQANNDALQRLYFKGPLSLDKLLRQFVERARRLSEAKTFDSPFIAARARINLFGSELLLYKLNEAVSEYERIARKGAQTLQYIKVGSLILTIIVLILEGFFIFWPAHLAAAQAISEREKRLKAARETVAMSTDELVRLRNQAEHDALHDALTGLPNRRHLERTLDAFRTAIREQRRALVIMHIDLDHFKQINDTLGHAAGDYVLQIVAEALREETRPDDLVARIGGDEFVVVMRSRVRRRDVESIAGRIIARLSQPVVFEGETCVFGASVGIDYAEAAAEEGERPDPSRTLQNADIALYRAKELGRGRFVVFSIEMREKIKERKSLSDDLMLGLPRGEFLPYYQPQVDAATGRLQGVEALARWNHPTRGVVPPSVFLPIAERLSLVPVIDRQILEQAIADLKRWDAAGLHVPRVSVNISAHQLKNPDLLTFLRQADIPKGRVVFEVLESVFSDEVDDKLRHILDCLQDFGIEIEVDDFGTGHASLVGLLALSPARLKIARELIAPLPTSESHTDIVRAIVAIARSLNIEVVAEGIETQEHRVRAKALGCSTMQGFFFAKPMPAEALAASVAGAAPWREQTAQG